MIFLGFSYGFPMIFLWFSYNVPIILACFLRKTNSIPGLIQHSSCSNLDALLIQARELVELRHGASEDHGITTSDQIAWTQGFLSANLLKAIEFRAKYIALLVN